MRAKYIVQVVFLFVFANSNAQIGTKGIDYDLFYISVKRQIEKLPNGEHKLHFKNNQLKSVFTLKNGKLHGNTKEYYENGQLKFEGQYQNGKREGNHREYYKNGSLESDMNFEKDKILGSFKFFYKNGMVKYETSQTKNGKDIIGYSKIFVLMKGRKKRYRNKKTNKIRIVELPDTTYLSRHSQTKNYKLHGEAKSYNRKGRLTSMETYENNKLIRTDFYNEDGTSETIKH